VTAKLLTGAPVAEGIKNKVSARIEKLAQTGIRPGLAALIVGNDPASRVYVDSKVRTCEELGIYSEKHQIPESSTTAQLLEFIASLNSRDEIDGILVQLPLPAQLDTRLILESVSPEKDVDGLSPVNVGRLVAGVKSLVACTPAGIIELLDFYEVPIQAAHAVIVGRSDIVGKPMSLLLLHRHATVTICHSRTRDLASITRQADILVAAIGRAGMISGDMIKPGSAIIDVGINRVTTSAEVVRLFPEEVEQRRRLGVLEKRGFTLAGDVDYQSAITRAGSYTPVPGGVGPLTIAMLMSNTVSAAEARRG
jgi:methylenetetrahydrofolate dehydrogenase (NADP+)/methenyltetrahydrofolate cyclohydrolase